MAEKKKAQKFYTTVDRYVHGKYIRATPEYPALITLEPGIVVKLGPDGTPEDKTLIPYVENAEPPKAEKLAVPFADIRRGPKDRTDEGDEGRPSDRDPAGR